MERSRYVLSVLLAVALALALVCALVGLNCSHDTVATTQAPELYRRPSSAGRSAPSLRISANNCRTDGLYDSISHSHSVDYAPGIPYPVLHTKALTQ